MRIVPRTEYLLPMMGNSADVLRSFKRIEPKLEFMMPGEFDFAFVRACVFKINTKLIKGASFLFSICNLRILKLESRVKSSKLDLCCCQK